MYLAYVFMVGGGFVGAKAMKSVAANDKNGHKPLKKASSSFFAFNPMAVNRGAPPPPPPPPEKKNWKEKAKLDSSSRNVLQFFSLFAGRSNDPSEADMEMAMKQAHKKGVAGESTFAGVADRQNERALEKELEGKKERVRQLEEKLRQAKKTSKKPKTIKEMETFSSFDN